MGIENVGVESGAIYSDIYESDELSPAPWNGRLVTIENASNRDLVARIVLCGERCNGEATLHAMVDTDDNKSIDLEVEVESENGRFLGSISGEVSQDKDGNTTGKVETDWSFKF